MRESEARTEILIFLFFFLLRTWRNTVSAQISLFLLLREGEKGEEKRTTNRVKSRIPNPPFPFLSLSVTPIPNLPPPFPFPPSSSRDGQTDRWKREKEEEEGDASAGTAVEKREGIGLCVCLCARFNNIYLYKKNPKK